MIASTSSNAPAFRSIEKESSPSPNFNVVLLTPASLVVETVKIVFAPSPSPVEKVLDPSSFFVTTLGVAFADSIESETTFFSTPATLLPMVFMTSIIASQPMNEKTRANAISATTILFILSPSIRGIE